MDKITELYRKIGIDIDIQKLEEVLCHASYQNQNNDLRKRNKDLNVYGSDLAKCLHALYAYTNRKCEDEGALSKLISSSYSLLLSRIYEKYHLISYELVCEGEKGKEHIDTAAKLLALIYQKIGLIKTYDFFKFEIAETCIAADYDYKSILLEYVQQRKWSMAYEIIDIEGPADSQIFTCELKVGNYKVISQGRSKKDAQKAAAKEYIISHNIALDKKSKTHRLHIDEQKKINSNRRNLLNKIYKQLSLSENDVSMEYMNAVFVHKSALEDKRIQSTMSDNSMLNAIGANIAIIYALDYVTELEYYKYIDVNKEVRSLINQESGNEALPKAWLEILLTSKGMDQEKRIDFGKLKVEIYHSILASLVLYGIKSERTESEIKSKKIARAMLETISKHRGVDCTTTLQEVADIVALNIEKSECMDLSSPGHRTRYVAKIICRNELVNISVEGTGSSKKKATNVAAQKALLNLLDIYKQNSEVHKVIYKEIDPEKYYQLMKSEETDDCDIENSIQAKDIAKSIKESTNDAFDDMELEFLRNLCV